MPSLVFDFEDIHKRMLGDLKQQPKVKEPGTDFACKMCDDKGVWWSSSAKIWQRCRECDAEPF